MPAPVVRPFRAPFSFLAGQLSLVPVAPASAVVVGFVDVRLVPVGVVLAILCLGLCPAADVPGAVGPSSCVALVGRGPGSLWRARSLLLV